MSVFYSIKNKIILMLLIVLIGVIILSFNMFKWYLNSVTPKITLVIESKLEKITYDIITSELNINIIENDDLLILTKNNNEEIISVDYDLKKAYEINNIINQSIRNNINNLASLEIDYNEFLVNDNYIYINEPLFINSSYSIISALGPKIPIKVEFIGTVITNLKTKVNSYGLNNALSEIYVTVEIIQLITTPVSNKKMNFKYDILIDAVMINGRVPTFYGGEYISESNAINVPIN